MNHINEILQYLKNCIEHTELESNVYVFGGYLRDRYFNIVPNDIDLIISVSTMDGIEHKLSVIFNVPENELVFTSEHTIKINFLKFNIDVRLILVTDGKSAILEIRESILAYCDFSINALCENLTTGELYDFNGHSIHDINNRILRLNYDINTFFIQYPSRVYRLIRFAASLKLAVPLSVLRYIKRNSHVVNFVDRELLISEYNRMKSDKNFQIAERLLDILNINPINYNRHRVFFLNGWHELEPGQCPNRILPGDKFKWTSGKSDIFLNEVIAIQLTFEKNAYIDNDCVSYYFDNDENSIQRLSVINGINNHILYTLNKTKMTILSNVFIPSNFENTTDCRKLGIRLISIAIIDSGGYYLTNIESIPYGL